MGLRERVERLMPTRRGPSLRLGLRNLYMVPTRFGFLWLGASLLLQVVAVQMQRNGPLLLSFLLLGLFLLTMHLTPLNLRGVELASGTPAAGHAGTALAYPLRLHCPGRCEGLELQLGKGPLQRLGPLEKGEHRLAPVWTAGQRGWQSPGPVRLQTTAPLGLFVCWTRWEPAAPQLVYPAQRAGPVRETSRPRASRSEPAAGSRRAEGAEGDEWHDLRPHRPEDGSTRLAWKLVAQGRGRYSKSFLAPAAAERLLAPDPALPLETALEHLSERIGRLHGLGETYGLQLPDQEIPPAAGAAQRDRCLAALALTR
jgi:uncharacterized protein (DUF58 family)